jgi:hypothetical protein
MVTLKELDEYLVLNEIKQNYFLNILYEAKKGYTGPDKSTAMATIVN